jgi:DNA-directed RNA polymerase specialized sigma24 family protein/ribosome-associated translation inhibitor RaiA
MQIQINSENNIDSSAELTRRVEAVVEGALGRFGDRITRVEVYLSQDNTSQKSGGNEKRCVMEARLAGLQPIAVSHQGSSVEQALDGAANKLEKTLKRTLGRKDSLLQRKARERAELTAADILLNRNAEVGKQEDFFKLLRPLLGYLRDHARRELRILEINGALHPGEITVDDLLDDVVTRAWLQFADRSQRMSLDLWLMNLLYETFEVWTKQEPRMHRSLHERAREVLPEDVPQVDDQEWWVWLLGEEQTITLEDTIPSRESTSAQQQLEANELKDRIHALVGKLSKPQRQAFVLNVFEAYEPFEIAMLQDRPETEVRADIEAARNTLREQLRAGSRPQASALQ